MNQSEAKDNMMIDRLQALLKNSEKQNEKLKERVRELERENEELKDAKLNLNSIGGLKSHFHMFFSLGDNNGQHSKTHKPLEFQRRVSIAKPEQVQGSQNLFESFFIVGADSDSLNGALEVRQDTVKLKPKILSSYPYQSCEKYEDIIYNIFPKGIQVTKATYKRNDQKKEDFYYSKLYRYLLNTQSQMMSQNEFILTMQDTKSLNLVQNNSLLTNSNPNNFIYCVCFQFKDFHRYTQQKKDTIEVYFNPVVYCFITYYPFFNFFIETLAYIRNNLKDLRLKYLNSLQNMIEVDHGFTIKLFNQEQKLTQLFSQLYHQKLELNGQYDFGKNIFSQQLTLMVPNADDAKLLEAQWGASLCFSILSYQQMTFILSCLLLELKVILISNDQCLLSATILTFFYLLRPFKYIYPYCLSLQDDRLYILGCPTALFFGLRGKYLDLAEEINDQIVEGSVYIGPKINEYIKDLDYYCVRFSSDLNFQNIDDIAQILPKEISECYSLINRGEGQFVQITNTYQQNQYMCRYKRNEDQSPEFTQSIKNIIEQLQLFYIKEVTQWIPKTKYFISKNQADMKQIVKEMKEKNKFSSLFSQFLETQAFVYYIQELYERTE